MTKQSKVRLVKAISDKGYFLTIEEISGIANTWAVTAEELLELLEILKEIENDLEMEVRDL